ncbi:MAG: metallopeptidase TldD-related protein, partial [candidate division WOR-3 bacterium]
MNQYQISKIRQKVDLTRFANSTIHQNVTMDEVETKILYAAGKRIGVLSSIGKEIDIETAKHIAQNSMENPDFVSLVDNEEAGVPEYRGSYSPSTAQTKPMHRAEIVKEVIELCNKKRLQTAGYLSTGFYEMEISNSLGVNVRDQATMAEFSLTVTGEGTGYSTATSFDLSLLNITDLTNRAIETAMKNIKPVMIEPKKYRVILEPMAVHDLFGFLSWLGFSGLMYYEGRSCFAGRLNQEVASPLITLYDEPITGLPNLGIDVEGVARRKTILIEKGVLKNVVYDSYSAHKIGTKSTGNAYELISPIGGFPFSITQAPGETSNEK